MKFFKIAIAVILSFIIVLSAVVGIYIFDIYNDAKNIDISFENGLDKFVFLEFFDSQNNPAPLACMDFCESCDIGQNTFNAFIAKEDKRFYNHNGIDLRGILRACAANIKNKRTVQGGSTITQQLAKNLVLSSEKKLSRKISEVALSREIESRYTKEEILTMYLNVIYFGENTFGITNASMLYFGKKPCELSLSESAMLAGIIASPENYSPIKSLDIAQDKRDIVLSLMQKQGYISHEEYQSAIDEKLQLAITKTDNIHYDYFNHTLKEAAAVLEISESELARKDYKIFTYIDEKKQAELHDIGKNEKDSGCVLIALDNQTRGVLGVFESGNDLILQRRSPASLIKPLLVYGPALEENIIFENSIIKDEQTDFGGYQPRNYMNIYYGDVTAKTALAKSLNIPSVKILESITVPKAKAYASKLGMALSPNDEGLSVALGGLFDGVSPMQIASAYMCVAVGGEFEKPCFVREIQDSDGNIIYSRKHESTRVFGDDTAYILTDMLKECTASGTGRELYEISPNIACKTGTNGDQHGNLDAYSCAYTTKETFFCHLGNEDYSYMPLSVKGSSAPIQNAKRYFGECGEIVDFLKPESVDTLEYDRDEYLKNGKLLQSTSDTPQKFIGKTLISSRFAPLLKSLKYSYPRISNPCISQSGEFVEICLSTQDFARYEIFDCYTLEKVAEFCGNGDVVSTVLPIVGDSCKFEICAYNSFSGKKGERYAFDKLYLKKDFMPPQAEASPKPHNENAPITDEEILDFFS